MKDNPYAAPRAKLVLASRHSFRWKSAVSAAAVAFFGLPLIIALLSIGRGMDVPDFLFAPGFLGTLAVASLLAGSALERTRLWTWLHWLLTVLGTFLLLAVVVVVMRAITR